MPRGPKGEKRPADVIGAAVKVMRIATGEEEGDARYAGRIEGTKWQRRFGRRTRTFFEIGALNNNTGAILTNGTGKLKT